VVEKKLDNYKKKIKSINLKKKKSKKK